MNLLQLISSGGYYGAENVIVSLSEALERKNCRSIIGVFQQKPEQNEELVRQAQRRGLTVLRIPCRGRWDWQTVRAIREILASRIIDVLHTHGYKPDIYGYLASRGLGVPRVATCHLWTHDTRSVRLYEFLNSLFLRKFDAVVAVSKTVMDSLHGSGVPSARTRVIENGVDLPFFTRERDFAPNMRNSGEGQTLIVGTVGRLVPQKGLEYFLRAAQGVIAEIKNAKFVIAGSGTHREKLERMTHDLGITERVSFLGHCADMAKLYASMDVFVLASLDEGMPMAVLEAMASKKPVIATSVGAVPQLVVPGKTGLLVSPKDVQSLKVAILRLLRDPALRLRLGESATVFVQQNYSHNTMAENYLGLYEQVIGHRGATSPRTLPTDNGAFEVTSE